MTEKAILDISHGDSPGFNVALEIEGKRRCTGELPPVEEIHQLYEQWRDCYIGLDKALRGKCTSSQAGNSQDLVKECNSHANNFLAQFKEWLESKKFEPVRTTLVEKKPSQLILRFQEDTIKKSPVLKRLPWNKWDLLDDPKHPHYLANTEFALSAPEYQVISVANTERIRILTILGNSEGINVNADRQVLEQLPGVEELNFLDEPKKAEISDQLWEQSWTILFFSGHSSSQGEQGYIFINKTDKLPIKELKHGLTKAIEKGLQLAIFNSCDGLKLAESLAELHIPQTIVMREPVPDQVAQSFLKFFLQEFTKGKTLYLSVKEARKRLSEREDWDKKIPGCTWLPVIWQNPAVEPISWSELVKKNEQAFANLQELAKQGNQEAQSKLVELGISYEKGKRGDKAFTCYENTAEQGLAEAQYRLGKMYLQGRLIRQDDELARHYFARAAKQGHIDSMYHLGCMYENRIGEKKDDKIAFAFLKESAELGHPRAKYYLAKMYESGKENLPYDKSLALKNYREAKKLLEEQQSLDDDPTSLLAILKDIQNILNPKPNLYYRVKIKLLQLVKKFQKF